MLSSATVPRKPMGNKFQREILRFSIRSHSSASSTSKALSAAKMSTTTTTTTTTTTSSNPASLSQPPHPSSTSTPTQPTQTTQQPQPQQQQPPRYDNNVVERSYAKTTSTTTTASTTTAPRRRRSKILVPSRVGQFVPVQKMRSQQKIPGFGRNFIAWGLPMIAFLVGGVWVVAQALEGKTKEFETSKGMASVSQRKAAVEEQQEEMMKRIEKMVQKDFDNTKRIERPEEILERRRREREQRNKWYNRAWRSIAGEHN